MDDFFNDDVTSAEDNPFASSSTFPAQPIEEDPDQPVQTRINPSSSEILVEEPIAQQKPAASASASVSASAPPPSYQSATKTSASAVGGYETGRPVSMAAYKHEASQFDIKVSDPEKKGEGMNAHMVYNITTKTTAPDFQNPTMNVTRRFTNFVWLYNQLTTKYPGAIVPPIPEKQALGRFETEFVEQRRSALEKCLRRIGAHPVLSKSPDFKLFIEASDLEGEIKKREPKKSLFSTLTSSMTDVVQNAAHTFSKIPETDEWFENKRSQLETLETHLKSLAKVVDLFVKQRKELGVTSGDFGDSVASLGTSEASKSLGACLANLGVVEKKIQEIITQQATVDEQNVAFVVDEYIRTIGSVKLALEARVKAYTAWKAAESSLAKKREQLTKISQQGNKAKTSALETEVDEGEKGLEKAKEVFLDITETLRKELSRFDNEKIEDFQKGMIKFVEQMVENQKKVISLWEGYLPEVQAL